MKKKTKLTAFCGICGALSVVLMLPASVIPVLTYISPILTGLVLVMVQEVSNRKWAFGVYVCTGVISLVLVTDKEAALTYITFFGYYPLLRSALQKLKKGIGFLLKLLLFNTSAVVTALAGIYIFAVPLEDYQGFGKYSVPILLLLGNLVFILYDFAFKKYEPILCALSRKLYH